MNKRQKMSTDRSGSTKLLTKLNEAMVAKKFYEAHQLLKTITFRYSNSHKYEELENLLIQYSSSLLEHHQIESGCDVAIMLAKLYKEVNLPLTADRVKQTTKLLEVMPPCPERLTYLMTLLECSSNSELSGKLHAAAATMYTKEHCFAEAWKHLVRVSDGADANAIALPILKGCNIQREEIDITISSLVMSFLAAKKIEVAEQTFGLLVKQLVHDLSPLLNGVRFLIEAAKMKNPKAFAAIKDVYEPSFSRDPYLRKLVAAAGKSLFNLSDRLEKPSNNFVPMLLNAFLNPDQANLD